MIGRCDHESAEHAAAAARAGGWHAEPLPLLNLGSLEATLHSVGYLEGLDAVIRLGQPHQPDVQLEQALLASPRGVGITDARAVLTEWTWVSRSGQVSALLVDDVGYRDCRAALEALGLPVRVVPVGTSMAERISLSGSTGSLLVERSLVPAGWSETGSGIDWNRTIWFGLCGRTADPVSLELPKVLWLSFAPVQDHRGSLGGILEILGSLGFDLVHLRSFELRPGYHIFFSAFVCERSDALANLERAFTDGGIHYRILAAIDQPVAPDASQGLAPVWGS